VIAVDCKAGDDLIEAHQQSLQLLLRALEQCGVQQTVGFMQGSPNFRFALEFSPHISLLKAARTVPADVRTMPHGHTLLLQAMPAALSVGYTSSMINSAERVLLERRVRQVSPARDVAKPASVVYLMSRDQRVAANHALQAAWLHAQQLDVPLVVVFALLPKLRGRSREHAGFYDRWTCGG
jgi:hypothetical protein